MAQCLGRCHVLFKDPRIMLVAKPQGLSGKQLADALTLVQELEEVGGEEKGVVNGDGNLKSEIMCAKNQQPPQDWRVFRHQDVSRNLADVAILYDAKASESVRSKLDELRRSGKLEKKTVAMVHGKFEQTDAEELASKPLSLNTEKIASIKVLSHYRTNNRKGWLTLISVWWSSVQQSALLKGCLYNAGFPIVGKGKHAVTLGKAKGNLFMTVGVRFPNPSSPSNSEWLEAQEEKNGKSYERLCNAGEREQRFWQSKTDERLSELNSATNSREMSHEQAQSYAESRKPVAHFTGEQQFGNVSIFASDKVFVPAPQSFCLVETATALLARTTFEQGAETILDLGCGSGCLLLALLSQAGSSWNGVGVDINPHAVELSRENAKRLSLDSSFHLLDFFLRPSLPVGDRSVSLVLCNPPYLPESVDLCSLVEFSPKEAIISGKTGMEIYHKLALLFCSQGPLHLACAPGALLVLEVPGNRKDKHREIIQCFQEQGLEHMDTTKDAVGMDRCLVFRSPS